MTKEQIAKWLEDLRQDREWLAEQCGTKKSTVDSWFSSRGFPPWAITQIERLVRETTATADGKFRVTFDTEEFERIDAARRMVGDPPRPQFYRDAIIDFADRIIAGEQDKSRATPRNVKPLYGTDPSATAALRAADEDHPRRKWGERQKSAG